MNMNLNYTLETTPFNLYLDLDGVFADFDKKFFQLSGSWPHEVTKKDLWKIVNSVDDYFYSLELIPGSDLLWNYCKQFHPKFLTGLPSQQSGKDQKIRWVAEKFGVDWETIVVPKRDKQLYSSPDSVLIDDTMVNIEQWTLKGGIGIYHFGNINETIEALEKLRISKG